jgi:hypothetical protein
VRKFWLFARYLGDFEHELLEILDLAEPYNLELITAARLAASTGAVGRETSTGLAASVLPMRAPPAKYAPVSESGRMSYVAFVTISTCIRTDP